MEDYSAEASIDVIQAITKTLQLHRPVILARIKEREDKISKKLSEGTEKLLGITLKAHDVLFRANTVFPFTLFPDTVTVDREKLTIANRSFFATAKIISVPIRDILSVEADLGPFFGSVHMTSRYFFTNPHSIGFLKRSDAIKLQRMLQGYIIAHEQQIDCSELDATNLEALLEDLGKGDTD